MSGCGSCSGDCQNCGRCGGSYVLNEGELHLLTQLAQCPFLPLARSADDVTPIYPEGKEYSQREYSLILQCLEKKQLISIDFDAPLKGCDASAYGNYPIRGSFALTATGQQILELLEIPGAQ